MHNNFFPLFKYKFNKIERERERCKINKSTKDTNNALEYASEAIFTVPCTPCCRYLRSLRRFCVARGLLPLARKRLSRNWFVITRRVKRSYSPMSPRWRIHAIWHYIPAKRSRIFRELCLLCIVRTTVWRTRVCSMVCIDVYASFSLSLSFSSFVRCNTRGPSSSPTKHVINRCHWSLMRERNKNVPRGSDYSRDSFHKEAGLLVLAPKET